MQEVKSPFKQVLTGDWTIALVASLMAFVVYLSTVCPGVAFTDSGELAAVAVAMGIAHPTGYPLFTLLGRCAVMVCAGAEEVQTLNRLAAFFTASAVGVFYVLVRLLLSTVHRTAVLPENSAKVISFVSALCFGFGSTIWSQSTAVEVYSLHLLLIVIVMVAFLRGIAEEIVRVRWLAFCAFMLGLSFGNHMTTVLLVPGFIYLYFNRLRFGRQSVAVLGMIAPFVVLGLSVYLFLSVRSNASPALDWGHPATLERFLWHVSGKQYRVWMFSGIDVMQKQFARYVAGFSGDFHWILLPFLIAGIVWLFRRNARVLIFLSLHIVATIFYATNYDIFDIESYFLLAVVSLGIILSFGIGSAVEWLARRRIPLRIAGMILILALPAVQALSHRSAVDESRNRVAEEYTLQVLSRLPANAVVLSAQWDYFISPALYFQGVLRMRPDVTIIDKALLQNRSWYYLQLRRHAPWILQRCSDQADRFLAELDKFEHDLPYNSSVIQSRWDELLAALVAGALEDHPVFIDVRIEPEFSAQYERTPWGVMFQLSLLKDSVSEVMPRAEERQLPVSGPVVEDLQLYQAQVCVRFSQWLQARGRIEEAKAMLGESKGIRRTSGRLVF